MFIYPFGVSFSELHLFSVAYGAAAPAMLNYFKPAPAPANGAPLPAEAQAELNARYAEQLAAKVAKRKLVKLTLVGTSKVLPKSSNSAAISKLGDKMGVG